MAPEQKRLVIGTRGSALALWQANHVADLLRAADAAVEVALEVISTKGDRILDRSLSKVGGKGLFVKEIEQALIEGRVDLAIHSFKDMPTQLPEGLEITTVLPRADHRDAWVSEIAFDALPTGAKVGTSSLRRQSQLLAMRSDLSVVPLRGNVDTRLAKLDRGEFDGIVLAAAGLERLGWGERIQSRFDLPWVSAAAQGALAIETRVGDQPLHQRLAQHHDSQTALAVTAERTVVDQLGGSCHVPIGAWATFVSQDQLKLYGFVGAPDGARIHRAEATLDLSQNDDPQLGCETLGKRVAADLVEDGAAATIDALEI